MQLQQFQTFINTIRRKLEYKSWKHTENTHRLTGFTQINFACMDITTELRIYTLAACFEWITDKISLLLSQWNSHPQNWCSVLKDSKYCICILNFIDRNSELKSGVKIIAKGLWMGMLVHFSRFKGSARVLHFPNTTTWFASAESPGAGSAGVPWGWLLSLWGEGSQLHSFWYSLYSYWKKKLACQTL